MADFRAKESKRRAWNILFQKSNKYSKNDEDVSKGHKSSFKLALLTEAGTSSKMYFIQIIII